MTPAVNKIHEVLQKKLFDTGISQVAIKYFEFLEDTAFFSPSTAANIELGRQKPGPIMWLDGKIITYKQFKDEGFC